MRRRLGQDGVSADDDSINVALTLGNGDVDRAVEILQEQHSCGDSASAPRRKGKQHANARPGQQENADLQVGAAAAGGTDSTPDSNDGRA